MNHLTFKLNTIKIKISKKKETMAVKSQYYEDLRYANSKPKDYKKLDRLLVENVLLYINFFDNDRTVKHNQLCVPQKVQI